MFVKINKNYLLVIFFLTLYLSNHRLSSVDSFHQFIRHQYFHLREAKPLLAQVLNGCTYVIYIIVDTKGSGLLYACRILASVAAFPIDGTPLLKDVGKLLHLSP